MRGKWFKRVILARNWLKNERLLGEIKKVKQMNKEREQVTNCVREEGK